ncbi:RHS repeat protein [bacterium]|nr:RHS repeat protein [bacterium]
MYGFQGRLVQVRDALNDITQYQYDANGNLTKVVDGKLKVKTDGRGWKTYFFYDSMGRLMHKLYNNGTGEGYKNYAVGRLTRKTLPNRR